MLQKAARQPVCLAWPVLAGTGLWLLLLIAILGIPYLIQSATLDSDLTRNTVRLSLLYYSLAAALMLLLHPDEWTARSRRGATARWFWTLAWAAFLVHLVMAFHHAHHWSHADAVKHTEEVSNFGAGIYFSHLFTLVWSADVLFWWFWPLRFGARASWIDRSLHGFMVFMIFNATVVFGDGLIRWAGTAMFLGLGGIWLDSWVRKAND